MHLIARRVCRVPLYGGFAQGVNRRAECRYLDTLRAPLRWACQVREQPTSTFGSLGSEKWSTPGLSVRLKWKQGMACHARTASLVMSSWLPSPSRVKNFVDATTTWPGTRFASCAPTTVRTPDPFSA